MDHQIPYPLHSTPYSVAVSFGSKVRRRGYCDHFVTVWGCVCLHDETKTPDWNNLKLGTVVVVVSL